MHNIKKDAHIKQGNEVFALGSDTVRNLGIPKRLKSTGAKSLVASGMASLIIIKAELCA